jgi:hypothetical protein
VPVPGADIYRGILGDITLAAAETTEADPVGIHVSLLTGASVAAGGTPHIWIGADRHPLLVYGLLFGRTSTGRKGSATAAADLYLARAWPEYDECGTSGLSSGEGLIEQIRDGDGGKDPGVADKRLYVTESEFASVMARMQRDGSTLGTTLRKAWEGRPLRVINRRQYGASWSHIAVLAHISPAEFRRRLAEADMAGGTYNRFLPVWVERAKRLPMAPHPDEKSVAILASKLTSALSGSRRIGAISMTADAETL